MKKLSEIPFICISQENLTAAKDMLNLQEKGELLEMLIEAVTEDASPSTENRYVQGVFNQFMAVIERKAESYNERMKGLDKFNAERKSKNGEPQASEEPIMDIQLVKQEPIVNIQTEKPYTQTATPQPSEHQAPVRTDNEWVFDTEDDAINYLVDVWSKEGLHTMERQRKYILDTNGYEFRDFIAKLKERYNG